MKKRKIKFTRLTFLLLILAFIGATILTINIIKQPKTVSIAKKDGVEKLAYKETEKTTEDGFKYITHQFLDGTTYAYITGYVGEKTEIILPVQLPRR